MKADTIDVAGAGPSIGFSKPIRLPNTAGAPGSLELRWYSSVTGVLATTGCATINLNYNAVRVGLMVTIYIQCIPQTTLATAFGPLSINNIPDGYTPTIGGTRGLCQVNATGTGTTGCFYFQGTTLNIYSNVNSGSFNLGLPFGLYGPSTDFQAFTFMTS